jgi:hypothetical protein
MKYRFTHVSKTIQENPQPLLAGDPAPDLLNRYGNAAIPIQEPPRSEAQLLAAVKAKPGVPGRDLARALGVSHGKVQRLRKKLEHIALHSKAKRPGPSLAEQNAIRAQTPRFDDKTREERGMVPREMGGEQHPDYPPGWTYDVVHREQHGRIQPYTMEQKAQIDLNKTFLDFVVAINRASNEAPEIATLARLNQKNREHFAAMFKRRAPGLIAILQSYLNELG